MSELLLDRRARRSLARWIEGLERPKNIPPERWTNYQKADAGRLPFADLAELCDVYSPRILDALRWPETRAERQRLPAGGRRL